MTARILRFPLPAQEPIRMAMPAHRPVLHVNVPLIIVALALLSGTVAVPIAIAWRFFHG